MDINKFKSVAVRKADYDILQGLCNQKFRSPASMISKLVNEYVEYQAMKNKFTIPEYKKLILKLDNKSIGKKNLNVRTMENRTSTTKLKVTRKGKRKQKTNRRK